MTIQKWQQMIAVATVCLAVVLAGTWIYRSAIHTALSKPVELAAPLEALEPIDYSSDTAWAVLPEHLPDGGWETPWGIDVFVVHPTTGFDGGAGWNTPIDNKKATIRLDTEVVPVHLQPFAGAGPVYAPRYRQAALYVAGWAGEPKAGSLVEVALAAASADILAAFDYYMEAKNQKRGIVLVGIGQGAHHAAMILRERFSNRAEKRKLAAVYLVEPAPLSSRVLDHNLPLCSAPSDIQCMVIWSQSERAKGSILPCVNPVTFEHGETPSIHEDHRGGAFISNVAGDNVLTFVPKALRTQCVDGQLKVDEIRSGNLKPSFLDTLAPHSEFFGFNRFYSDIEADAANRSKIASVWLDKNERKPARPLPPIFALEDAPIHRENGVAQTISE